MRVETLADLESRRIALQADLDMRRELAVRNRKGQFATPGSLAEDMQRYAYKQLGASTGIRFMDPAFGTGSFYSALQKVFSPSSIYAAVGYETDPYYGQPAARLWRNAEIDIRLEDFTQSEAPSANKRFNLVICNPPYIRHHHIAKGEKRRLQQKMIDVCGMRINGLAGLHCYFLGLSHTWMTEGGLAGWLIPSEFMDVNYGVSVKHYLLNQVTLLHIHRFDPVDVQFGDALVSSAIVWFRNQSPPRDHRVRFSYGGTLEQPALERLIPAQALGHDPKWTRYPASKRCKPVRGPVLGDFFRIKRGLVTGSNEFFILTEQEIAHHDLPKQAFSPILPSPRHLPEDEVKSDQNGNPVLKHRLFLLDPPWTEDIIKDRYPQLWKYLEDGRSKGISDRYVCRHRKPWYRQENRPSAPIVCNYLGRNNTRSGRPFRFILNNSRATAANVYLMLYPTSLVEHALQAWPDMRRKLWKILNEICPQALLGEGRVYGGGLHKLEPKELSNVPGHAVAELLSVTISPQDKTMLTSRENRFASCNGQQASHRSAGLTVMQPMSRQIPEH